VEKETPAKQTVWICLNRGNEQYQVFVKIREVQTREVNYDLMGNNPLYIHLAVMQASVNMLI